MKITVIDLEYNKDAGTIRELAIADVDDTFKLSEKRKLEIDPRGKNGFEGRGDKSKENFSKLRNYLTVRLRGREQDVVVVGWDVEHDAETIGMACINNGVDFINFQYFDLQKCYGEICGLVNKKKLEKAIEELGIKNNFTYHDALEDVHATIAVARAMCEKQNCSFTELIERYPSCMGKLKKGKTKWLKNPDPRMRNRADGFNISVDLPVLYFKKNVGPINKDHVRDGVCVYYDPLLKECFHGKGHPGDITKAQNSYLLKHPVYREIESEGLTALKKQQRAFYTSADPSGKKRATIQQYAVSLDLFAEADMQKKEITIQSDCDKLHEIGKTDNKFVSELKWKKLEGEVIPFVKKIYKTAEFLKKAILKSQKWEFGGKTFKSIISNPPDFDTLSSIKNKNVEFFIPREFGNVLESDKTVSVAFQKDLLSKKLISEVKAKEIRDIATVTDCSEIKLVAREADGQTYAYIPFKVELTENLFNEKITLPFLARISFDAQL